MQDKWQNTDLNVSLYWPEFLALPPQNGLCGPCLPPFLLSDDPFSLPPCPHLSCSIAQLVDLVLNFYVFVYPG